MIPKISVIMPVRNTPNTVFEQCLESIEKQVFKEFELICVDDASDSEATKQVLQKYGESRDNVTIVWLKEKKGAAAARNIGFKHAKGDYIIFLDSDDLFNEFFLEKMYEQIRKSNADVCICGFSLFQDKGGRREVVSKHRMELDKINFDDERILSYVTTSPWNKLCKRNYLVEERIEFQSLSSDNDVYYALMTILSTNDISYIPDCDMVFYRYNTDFQISSNINPMNLLTAIKKTRNDLLRKEIYKKWHDSQILNYLINIGIMEIKRCANQDRCKKFYEESQRYLNEMEYQPNELREREMLKYWRDKSYHTNWIDLIGDYNSQLNNNRDDLLYNLKNKGRIYVWGLGKRGQAFITFAQNNNVIIEGVYDKKGICCSLKNDINLSSPEEILCSSDLIIATNAEIFEYLSIKNKNSAIILNLEEYCPL